MNTNHVIINSTYMCLTNINDQLDIDGLRGCSGETEHRLLNVQSTNMTTKTYDDIDTIVKKFGISDLSMKHCTINNIHKLMDIVSNSAICCLTIGNCHDIDDDASICIASMLSSCVRLTSLTLTYNAMTINGFKNIMRSVTTNTVLKELCMSDNNLFGHQPTDTIIETVPLMKTLRSLSVPVIVLTYRYDDVYKAFKHNYSIMRFNTFNLNNGSLLVDKIDEICERNSHIRFYAYSRLVEIAVAFAPLIRIYGWFDAYCMLWIYDYIHQYNICANEFKKIKIIRSVFEFYRRKIRDDSSRAVSLCS